MAICFVVFILTACSEKAAKKEVVINSKISLSAETVENASQSPVVDYERVMKKPSREFVKEKAKKKLMSTTARHAAMSFSDRIIVAVAPSQERYTAFIANKTLSVQQQPVSTFSIDVDTASYSNMRRFLMLGQMPHPDAVRIEEMINYFSYDYPKAKSNQAFTVNTEMGPAPWDNNKKLLHIGIQGKSIAAEKRPAMNLVFLIDVSGSMQSANKLGLLKAAMKMLTQQMTSDDRISIVVYAGNSGTKLSATPGNQKRKIKMAIDELAAGGSTHGSAGIQAAYALAAENFIDGGVNRIMLATDGDFNVGLSDNRSLKQLIEQKRKTGISLSVLGFGQGNYNDSLMQTLAQNGNGNAYYIDTFNEARKVLVDDLSATLVTIAKDVKIQIEFNPDIVREYRLIGYETRHLNREDFNNDRVDAGEIGAGHTVTALYELTLADSENKLIDDLRYQSQTDPVVRKAHKNNELAFLRLRYKTPNSGENTKSQLLETVILKQSMQDNIIDNSNNYRFSAAVAAFGQLLRHDTSSSTMTWPALIQLAQSGKGKDTFAYRGEFIQLVKLAETLQPHLANNSY
ncbi:MAG: VWA domain-containing protein [Pseudomonadales bacterium]|nr:VWA domain-containing protein [Pseudomonadales bacterium]